jgi:hypothetical protein
MARAPVEPTVGQKIRRRLVAAFVPAIFGAVGGYYYAQYTLAPEVLEKSTHLLALYGSMGAIAGVLTMRIAALGRLMFKDFFTKR